MILNNRRLLLTALLLMLTSSAFAADAKYTPAFVDSLMGPYYQMQEGLSSDDLVKTQSAATALAKAMSEAPADPDFAEVDESLIAAANSIAKASDLGSARTEFQHISTELVKLLKHAGVAEDKTHFVHFCPMAHKGEGGTWIQPNDGTANPYFGQSMLKCGSVKEKLSAHEHGFNKQQHH